MISLDPVSWTLAVELVFYLLAALFFRLWLRVSGSSYLTALPVLVLGAAVSMASIIISQHPAWWPVVVNTDFIAKSLHLVSFMLVGTSFYLHIQGRLRDRQFFMLLLIQFIGFIKTHQLLAAPVSAVPLNIATDQLFNWYGIALLLFAVFYLLRTQFTFAQLPNFLADISYPLYLCHSYMAYFIMGALLYATPLPKSLVVFIPIPFALGAAYVIHRYCERKFSSPTYRA